MNAFKNLVLSAVSGAALIAGATSATADESFILAHGMNTDHVFHSISESFMEKLGDDSGLEVDYHPAGDLGDWTSLFEQSMQGVVPMSLTWGASDFDQRLDLSWLGYVVSNWEDAKKVYGPGSDMLGIYNDILHDLDLHAIGLIPTDFGSVVIRKGVGKVPTTLPADGSGIKIRVPGVAIAVDRFTNLGFSAVPIPLSEVYTALQLGTVDARSFSTAVETYNMRDVLETNILTNDYFETAFWLVSKDWWDDLAEEDAAKIQSVADEVIEASWEEAEAKSNEFLAKAEEAGVNIVNLSDAEMEAAKAIIYETEWPEMEKLVGPEIMGKLRVAAGIE
ncbi:TRAP-type C4-dicarboxylate transport system substrate-binding protein [Pacificibacter maritimus]|uniref:TRAP-type C4-dicarboxylate transport system substrate-binding protein n=1 Tax=Pacificibacter maritimus TaxID=762213 RepID=A0A3N4UA12_9RHOB|nr:TRAP transporter substrate-binding protein DctP [Pacificibacter maritimus]RPE66608.1 TRAP-type C4-dicarboxylate transport system substrate-binding protein [Pacificibacter maritimus]